jgi:cytoskeletal protein CcmA (bactofilin family)
LSAVGGNLFALVRRGTVIAKGLKIVGSVAAEGLVEVNGQIEGELHCTSLIISRQAHVTGTIAAERVVVDGRVDGPIQGGEVVLKSQAKRQSKRSRTTGGTLFLPLDGFANWPLLTEGLAPRR